VISALLKSAVLLTALALPAAAPAVPVLPDFGAATFVPGAAIDNRYFPLLDRHVRVYVDEDEGEAERFETQVVGPGRVLLGVQTTAVRDRGFEDGRLVEDTFDYFAQDSAGNVWYFGEDVTNYRYGAGGQLIGTDSHSSWLAGRNLADPAGEPAKPGFIMLANPTVGSEYFQEFAEDDEAVDQARVFSIEPRVETPAGSFTDVLKILETNPLEPEDFSFKYYASGVGLIAEEEGLTADFPEFEARLPLTRVLLVPEPPSVLMLAAGLAMLLAVMRGRGGR
jgi:hypothetical protein